MVLHGEAVGVGDGGGGVGGAGERAREDAGDGLAAQGVGEGGGLATAEVGERGVSATQTAAVLIGLGLRVADEDDAGHDEFLGG